METSGAMVKIIFSLPVFICLIILFLINRTDGNIIAGFVCMSEEKKAELRKKGYLVKTKRMLLFMMIPLIFTFISSFVVKDIDVLVKISTIMWFIFFIIVIVGVVVINLQMKDGYK